MLSVFSFIYGPLIIWMMSSFKPLTSSFIILIISVILIFLHVKEKSPVWIIPFVYFLISLSTIFFGKTAWLKLGPIAISLGVAILLSMKDKTHIMVLNAVNRYKKIREKNFTKEQIRSNAWIWISAAWLNVILHAIFLFFAKDWIWAFYVSVGWYGIFLLAGIIHIYIWQYKKRRERKEVL